MSWQPQCVNVGQHGTKAQVNNPRGPSAPAGPGWKDAVRRHLAPLCLGRKPGRRCRTCRTASPSSKPHVSPYASHLELLWGYSARHKRTCLAINKLTSKTSNQHSSQDVIHSSCKSALSVIKHTNQIRSFYLFILSSCLDLINFNKCWKNGEQNFLRF